MIFTKRIIEKKQGEKWIRESVNENSNFINVMLSDEFIGKYLFRSEWIKSIRYKYGKIVVYYDNGTRVTYEQ